MARIMIKNLFNKTLNVNDHSKTILQHFHDNGIDWMHACGGKGRCTTCKVIVRGGESNMDEFTNAERRYSAEGGLKADERLACQAKIKGDVCLLAPGEYRLPHIHYSDDV